MPENLEEKRRKKRVIILESMNMKFKEEDHVTDLNNTELQKVNDFIIQAVGFDTHCQISVLIGILATMLSRMSSEDRAAFLMSINTNVMAMARKADEYHRLYGEHSARDNDSY